MIYFSTRMINPQFFEDRLSISCNSVREWEVREVAALCRMKNDGVLNEGSLLTYLLFIDSYHKLPLKIDISKGAILHNDDNLIDLPLPKDEIVGICEGDVLFIRLQTADPIPCWVVLQFTYRFDED